jgi:hypothetical protein
MEHLKELAESLREVAMAFRWLAALAGADGDSLKSTDIQNKADGLDHSALLLETIANEFKEAEEAAAANPTPPPTEPVEDMEDDDEVEDDDDDHDPHRQDKAAKPKTPPAKATGRR